MNSRILLVVGDKFANYVQGKDAITLSQLRGLLSFSIPLLPGQGRTLLVPGQGLGDASIKQLLAEAAVSPNLAQFDFTLWHSLPERAAAHLTHKHQVANTLISSPRRLSETRFETDLMIDEDCELMQDHLSGQHIQGMILIEAIRQALTAITEAYLMPKNDINYAFVFNGLSVEYAQYAFPVGAVIRCNMTEISVDNPRRLGFTAEIEVEQCGQKVSTSTFSFGAMEKLRISKLENMQAIKVQADYLAQVSANMQQFQETLGHVENL